MKSLKQTTILMSALFFTGEAWAQDASSFVSPEGQCRGDLYETIDSFERSGNSVTVRKQQLKSGPLAPQPMTNTFLEPFTPVKCYAAENGLVLVLAEEGGNNCGWVPRNALLGGGSNAQGGVLSRGLACPTLKPLAVQQFCERGDTLGAADPLCDGFRTQDGSFAENPIETKFLTWNSEAESNDRMSVPLYDVPSKGSRLDHDLSVFSVFKVWDMMLNDEDELFYLIGPDQKTVEGWVREDAGTIWFSRLTTFFAENSKAAILTAPPGTSNAEPLAKAPATLAEMLNDKRDFDKYPVLLDKRSEDKRLATSQDAHAEVAFIGSRCGSGQLCAESSGQSIGDQLSLLDQVDVLFVLDATKSMDTYFPIIAEEVSAIALDRASTTNRFGAVMYGDFLRRSAKGLDDPMQIKTAVDLTEIYLGDEFEDLLSEPLFLDDPLDDKPEAAFAAVYQAIKSADWRDGSLRIVIHLADHKDRGNAPQGVIDLLKDEKVLYLPIAVRGEFLGEINEDFVKQSQDLLDRTMQDGVRMGLEQTLVTYDPASPQSGEEAQVSIRQSLRGATEIQDVISQQIANILLTGSQGTVAESNRYPPGYSELTDAARKLFGIDLDDVSASAEARTLAAKGFVALPSSGASDSWDFHAAISQREVKRLADQFDILCKSMHDTTAQSDLSNALREVIQILTGDFLTKDNERFFAYFDNRDNIPLVSRTILGEGILDLGQDLNSFASSARQKVEKYRLEACRTKKLLNLIDSDFKVDRPWENGPDGKGDLFWDASRDEYIDLKARKFVWTNTGIGGVVTIYLPLTYLPRPYDEIIH
ncbi:hypothetical protein TRP8649_03626 [Pelagimonas phthalicica]|uniref:VWFA domain-containing protein n=1 Tax=Pelagimonas phthalicica TaxID=1037362 RepID=A0A238JFM9_9RHOB|nr:hypothetical protein [Pelagimonas phthalicica]TDS92429.1 hypothetical protein CLV87_3624 [Pelagimonas phthalicica]SMX29490.1 hypothetical protein TRP8649_03626 [Pelagimonas phthalicica]